MSLARRILSLAIVLSPLGCGGGSTPGGVAGAAGAPGTSGAAGVTGTAGATGTAGGTGFAGAGAAGTSGAAGDTGAAGSTGNDASTTDATIDAPASTEGGTDGAAPTLNADIVALMRRVADNFLRNPDMAKDWISRAGGTGIMATYQLTHDAKYLDAIST